MKTLNEFSQNKQIKVLVFAKHVDGGTGTFVEQLLTLREAKGRKIVTQAIVLEKPKFRTPSQANSSISYFSNQQLLPYSYILTPAAITNFYRELIWLQKNISKFQPDVVLSIDNHCNVLTCFCKMLFHASNTFHIILTIHNNISAVIFAKLPVRGRKIFQQICRYIFKRADAIVCVSRGVAGDAKKFFSLEQTPHVIHIGVNIQNIQRLARRAIPRELADLFRSEKIKIISIGRFAPQKDFKTLLYAFAAFHKKRNNAELIIIGDGLEKEQLVSVVRKLKIINNVHFIGWQQNVYPYIRASDVFVLSSHYEGFPYVLLEAGALGKPIIATDTPYGPRELLGDNAYGLVVPMKNPRTLANALESLMDKNTYAHYQPQIMKRVSAFSEATMIKRYQSLIEALA